MKMSFLDFLFPTDEKELFEKNKSAINSFEYTLLRLCLNISVGFTFVLSVASFPPFSEAKMRFTYLVFGIAALIIRLSLFFFKKAVMRFPQFYLYILFVFVAAFSVIVNFNRGNEREFVTAVCFLTVYPVMLIDKSFRVYIFCLAVTLANIFIAVKFKTKAVLGADIMDNVAFFLLGSILGTGLRSITLRRFDINRILEHERNTDALTSLCNRRKLFEVLKMVSGGKIPPVTGIFMIDIDKFKLFNDTYGHQAGDACLSALGSFLAKFGESNDFKFFRYGGEEFCGINGSLSASELEETANRLCAAVRELNIPFDSPEAPAKTVTISVGFTHFEAKVPFDYEKHIRDADGALYSAKNSGRNCAKGL